MAKKFDEISETNRSYVDKINKHSNTLQSVAALHTSFTYFGFIRLHNHLGFIIL